jgi:hypothetical protein
MPQQTHLQRIEDHVLQGEIHVARQRDIIALKRRRLQPTALSEKILRTLEASLALHREQRDRLLRTGL